MNDVRIAKAEKEQLAGIAELERLCFAEPWSEHALGLLLTNDAVGLVALRGTEVLGYGGMLLAPGEGQITNVAVRPEERRSGIGKAILSALLQEAKKRELELVSLEVRVSNHPAIKLYEGFGFAVAGVHKHFYRHPAEDAFVMLKRMSHQS